MYKSLNFLCAGAAQGLFKALQPRFAAEAGASLHGRFGAVGAMREALLTDEPCDVLIVTEVMIDGLIASGKLRAQGRAALGRVRTGIAVRTGDALPDIRTSSALKAALLAADALYCPDTLRATAGIHFKSVLQRLGILERLQPRLRAHPSGSIAMREMLANPAPRSIGCTQITEIKYSEGVTLVGPLPDEFELATVYAAAVSTRALRPELAEDFIAFLAGAATQAVRAQGGFEL